MYTDFFMAGFGGQGVLVVGNLVAEAAMRAGQNVTYMPSYGVEMRGGTANCTVVVSDKEIGSPIITHPLNALIFNPPSMSVYQDSVKDGGLIIYNSSLIEAEEIKRDDVKVAAVPFNSLADEMGNGRLANMIALGAAIGATGLLEVQQVGDAMPFVFAEKYHSFIPNNVKAVQRGVEYVQNLNL